MLTLTPSEQIVSLYRANGGTRHATAIIWAADCATASPDLIGLDRRWRVSPLVHQVGIEPTTHGLKVRCASSALLMQVMLQTGLEPATIRL